MPLNKQNITINEDRKDDDDEKKKRYDTIWCCHA